MEVIGSLEGMHVRLSIVEDRWLILSEYDSGREIARSLLNYPVSLEGENLRWGDRLIRIDSGQGPVALALLDRITGKKSDGRVRPDTMSSPVLPPPSASTSSKVGTNRQAVIVLGLVAAVVLVVVLIARGGGGDSRISVDYTVEVFADAYCEDFGSTGYGDIPFAEVEVIDGDGRLLGSSSLDGGYDLSNSCVFSAQFDVRKSGDGMYRITAGNSNRGYLNYEDSDISNGRLVVEASIGN